VEDRFKLIKRLMPHAKTLGLVYADMPQSVAYRKRVEDLLATDPNFKDMKVEFRSIPLAKGEQATKRMIMEAKKYIEDLNDKVDAFISPSDAMGTDDEFPQMVARTATKPLFGILKNDAADKRGAVAVLYPDLDSMGRHAAVMVHQLFQGKSIKDIYPRWTDSGIAVDRDKAKEFNISIPSNLQVGDTNK
jgi:putative ABC transport system substrate-binding protein